MPRVAYNRPLSKVGFRLIGGTQPAHAAALSGLGSLGDDSSTLANYGFTSAEIAQIISAHQACSLSEEGYQQLLSGTVDPSQLAAFLDADLGCPTGTSAAAAAAAGVPTGTTLIYTATIGNHLFGGGIGAFFSALAGALANTGLQVTGNTIVHSGLLSTDFQLTLLVTNLGFGKVQDVTATINGAIYAQRGEMPEASQTVVSAAPGAGGGAASGAPNITTFLQENMVTILLGLAAIVVLPSLIKKL